MSRVSPAKRDEKTGCCIDMRCSRVGGNYETGDPGECRGYHCPHCDTPTGMMGHKCPARPSQDACVAVLAPDVEQGTIGGSA